MKFDLNISKIVTLGNSSEIIYSVMVVKANNWKDTTIKKF